MLKTSRGGKRANKNTPPKRATFTTAMGGEGGRRDVEVKGVTFTYKEVDMGVFNRDQLDAKGFEHIRGAEKYRAVIVSTPGSKMNGLQIATGKTQAEAIKNAKDITDKNIERILKARKSR